ncbi:hypothetical protein D3C78_1854480 [compost metagenome]
MEFVKQGILNGVEYVAHFTELPDGQFMATIATVELGPKGFPDCISKTVSSKEEALEAIEDAWAELGKVKIMSFIWNRE